MQNIARQITLKKFQASLLTLAFGLLAASQAQAQEPAKTSHNIRIKNFGQMDDRFYRGAQPKEDDYKTLAALGITLVIDLRDDAKGYARQAAEEAGMRYVNIPMSDTEYPKEASINAFLKIANDPATGPFYVHCAGGRHRTGVMGAVYRYNKYGWNFEKVYSEMKAYDFYTRWGHGAMKDYVVDYYQHIQDRNITVSTGQPSTSN